MLLKFGKQLIVIKKNFLTKYSFNRKFCSKYKDHIQLSELVSNAIVNLNPMVALESTVLTHGMPWPINFNTAKSLEDIIVNEKCIPVTIGILNNVIKAGFSLEELKELATHIDGEPKKISRRDLYNTHNIKYGGTTVSATMIIAHKLGINIFATGGIGGVHRNVNDSMDISADIRELGRTPICVVSSGVKSFLDISKTLEYLETEGVFVSTLDSDDFPGFFIKSSGLKSPYNIKTIEQAAHIIYNMKKLNISSGILIAVPIPMNFEKDGILIQDAINKSIAMKDEMNISGAAVTPFLLKKVNELTNGKSLELNVKLIKNNAMIGAKIAYYLKQMEKETTSKTSNLNKKTCSTFAVIGGSIVDNNLTLLDTNIKSFQDLTKHASYNCKSFQTSGGVGRNLAEVFSRLGENCIFLSAIGNDLSSEFLKKNSPLIDWSRVKHVKNVETCNCSVIMLSNKNVLLHFGNFKVTDNISVNYVKEQLSSIKDNISLICMDSNLEEDVMDFLFKFAEYNNINVFVEPTDVLLAHKSLDVIAKTKGVTKLIDIISPNFSEFQHVYQILRENKEKYSFKIKDDFQNNENRAFDFIQSTIKNSNLLEIIPTWIIKLGSEGVVFASKEETFFIQQSKYFIQQEEIINASGAGDCLAACALHLHFKVGITWKYSIAGGMRLAKESINSHRTVPESINLNNYSKNEIEKWTNSMFQENILMFIK